MLRIIVHIISMLHGYSAFLQKPDEIVFNQIKPFLYFDSNGTVQGFFPTMIESLQKFCNITNPLIDYTLIKRDLTFKEIGSIFLHTDYGSAELKNITGERTVWFPIMQKFSGRSVNATKKVDLMVLVNSPSIAVIAHRNKLSVVYKIFEAVKRCQQAVFIIALTIIVSAILIWLIECLWNKDFSIWFFKGFSVGIYWAFVTMSTVGYGDITPKTAIGRSFAILWMTLGIFMYSSLTGSFGATLSGTVYLDIKNKPVAAMANSFTFITTQKNYNVTLLDYESNEAILHAVNTKEVEFGLINVDVLSYVDRRQHPNVAVVKKLDIKDKVVMYYSEGSIFNKEKCVIKKLEETLEISSDVMRKIVTVETEYIQPIWEYITEHNEILYFCIALLAIIFTCAIVDVVHFAYNYCKKNKKTSSGSNNNGEIPMTVIQNGHAHKESDNSDIKKDIASIKEQVMKLNAMKIYKQKCPVCSWQT